MGADLKPGSLLARFERGEPFFLQAARGFRLKVAPCAMANMACKM